MKTSPGHFADDPNAADDAPLSKTRRKQQMHALQALGEKLVKLPAQQLARLTLPEDLAAAVDQARRIKDHEGRRRQLQYVGKLMRSVDAAAIEAQLTVDEERHNGAVHIMHRAERWRDGLLDGSLSLTAFIDEHPDAARAGLPALLAQARREKAANKPPRQQRQLYRTLHQILLDSWLPVPGAHDDAADGPHAGVDAHAGDGTHADADGDAGFDPDAGDGTDLMPDGNTQPS